MLVCSCAVLPAMRFWGHNAVLKCVAVATKMLVERLSGKQIALWVSSVFSALLLMQGIIVNGYLTSRPPLTENMR